MKAVFRVLTIMLILTQLLFGSSPKDIYENINQSVCLVSFFQNISSDAKIGSFDKIKRYCIGVMVNSKGLVMVTSEVYPVSLDFISSGGSFLSGIPTDFKVKLSTGTEYEGAFLGKDDQARVAFIQIQNKNQEETFPFIEFISTQQVSVADKVYITELLNQNYNFSVLFSPLLINAIVESPQRKFLINNQATALSAGGLVVDEYGKAIGVTISQVFDFTFMQPADYGDFHKEYLEIAPSEWFINLIQNPPNISNNQMIQNAWLGIRMQALTPELQEYWQVPQKGGVVVNRVFRESPAEKAKLKIGDVILAVNDSILEITKDEQTAKLRNIILNYPIGSEIKLKIFRSNKMIDQAVKLTAAPRAIGVAEGFPVPEWGFEIRELTRDILYQNNLPLDTKGVFVFQVDRASPGGIGGLNIGDIIQEINRNEIHDLSTARKIIKEELSKTNQMQMIKVWSNRTTRFVFIDLKK
jgi:S1-C subfamily serine protease